MNAPNILAANDAAIALAAARLRAGELVAIPTETVYGLGAHALDPRAVARIYAAKGRPSYNPLIVHVLGGQQARELAADWPDLAERLAARFWPGPLSLVLPKRAHVPDLVTAGLPTVAVRAPAHPIARAVLAAAALPIAAPSANRFQSISPTTAAHVARSLGDRVPLILDGGSTTVGIESTVLDLCGPRPVLLRPGGLAIADLEAEVGPIARATAVEDGVPRASPGLVDRHYAPSGRVLVRAAARLDDLGDLGDQARPIGAITHSRELALADHPLRLPATAVEYARSLYAALHTLDELGCATVVIEAVPDAPRWSAVRDRLRRAAS